MAIEQIDLPSSSGDRNPTSAWTTLLGLTVLVYYVAIWYVCILGLQQARKLFGKVDADNATTKARSSLPLRHPGGIQMPTSPPPSRRNGFAAFSEETSTADDVADEARRIGVSILRPLAGLDHNLSSNLASAFEQRYPKHLFEVILSVADANDQALSVARTVCARYADVQSRIIVGDEPCGVNPKICNLVKPYAAATFDIVWVLDAQVQVSPYALARAVHALNQTPPPNLPAPAWMQRKPHGQQGRTGLAHHVPFGVTPVTTSLGSHVEAIFLSTNHAKMYLAINALSVDSCVMGKSNLYRKSDLACVPDSFFNVGAQGTRGEEGAIGSVAFEQAQQESRAPLSQSISRPLARFSIFLAEDNMLALSLWRKPLDLAHTLIARDVARTSVGEVKSLADYWNRRVRWIRVRRHMVPAATYLEPFTESISCGAIATSAFVGAWLPMLGIDQGNSTVGRNMLAAAFFVCHLVAWHLVDFAVLYNVQRAATSEPANFTPLVQFDNANQLTKFRMAWLVREALALPIWFTSLCGNTVTWRTRRYKILSDARAAHIEANTRRYIPVQQTDDEGQQTVDGREA
jgi:ceramide glucosyltransferase